MSQTLLVPFRKPFPFSALASRLIAAAGVGFLALGCAAERGTIGAVLSQRADGRLTVWEAPAGLAAAKAGLEPGDEILLIDGEDARMLDERALDARLIGDVGQPVKLTVLRGERIIRVTLRRTPSQRWRPESPSR